MLRVAIISRVLPGVALGIALGTVTGVGCSKTNMCEARGGKWYDSVLDPRLPGSCVMPAVDVGQPCTEAEHCHAGYCACSDPAAKDLSHMTGVCPEFAVKPEDGWVCSVSNGIKHQQGVRAE